MALFNPPFHALPQLPGDPEPPPPFEEWPSFKEAPDRVPFEPWEGEPTWRWLLRRYRCAVYWAEEDARAPTQADEPHVVNTWARPPVIAGESKEERRARLNREAQARFRLRRATAKPAAAATPDLITAARADVAALRAKLEEAERCLAELLVRADLGESAV